MKQTTITIGGEERRLTYELAGMYDHLEKAAGKPAFEYLQKFTPGEGKEAGIERDDIIVFIYAGLNSALDEDNKPNVDLDTVKKWYRALKISDIEQVHTKVLKAIAGDEVGEGQSQPETEAN
jgi:hypothetical protein